MSSLSYIWILLLLKVHCIIISMEIFLFRECSPLHMNIFGETLNSVSLSKFSMLQLQQLFLKRYTPELIISKMVCYWKPNIFKMSLGFSFKQKIAFSQNKKNISRSNIIIINLHRIIYHTSRTTSQKYNLTFHFLSFPSSTFVHKECTCFYYFSSSSL